MYLRLAAESLPSCPKEMGVEEERFQRSPITISKIEFDRHQQWRGPMVLGGSAAGGAPDFEKVRTDSAEVPKIPPPGDAWIVPIISMHGACTNYPCASNW